MLSCQSRGSWRWALGSNAFQRLDDSVWRGLEWISYWILMPSLLVAVIIQAPDFDIPWVPLLGSMYGTLGLITVLLIAAWNLRLLGRAYPSFTSLVSRFCSVQYLHFNGCDYRTQSCPVATPRRGGRDFYRGSEHQLCGVVMTAGHSDRMLRRVFREILRNPLILACLLGGLARGYPECQINFPSVGWPWLGKQPCRWACSVWVLGCNGAPSERDSVWLLSPPSLQLVIKPLIFVALAIWLDLGGGLALGGFALDVCLHRAIEFYLSQTARRGCTVDGRNCRNPNRVIHRICSSGIVGCGKYELDSFAVKTCDLLVIGGGIVGLTVAREWLIRHPSLQSGCAGKRSQFCVPRNRSEFRRCSLRDLLQRRQFASTSLCLRVSADARLCRST